MRIDSILNIKINLVNVALSMIFVSTNCIAQVFDCESLFTGQILKTEEHQKEFTQSDVTQLALVHEVSITETAEPRLAIKINSTTLNLISSKDICND